MKKIFSIIVCAYFMVGCGATHQAKVRERINSNKNPKKEVLSATTTVKVKPDHISDYVEQYKDIAMANMRVYGIPASIKLAQAILESGAGRGKLATQANNHFGVKCQNVWDGETIKHTDDAVDECFRKYNSPAESFKDHSLFLTSRAHYKPLFSLDPGDYKSWAKGLKRAGYATDPNYPSKLISLIERYELYKYDEIVLGDNYKPIYNEEDNIVETIVISHIVQKGETLYSISRKYNVTIEQVRSANNISGNTISVGQKLRILK
ncbi:glucosaminidase domain-containing protein [Capnocytophaga sp. ARDL2]|uniref:glucosaminidase domain-containing protein n=1 Tax=Capnocytophaga sp. ARDL2 TaxID=3238809 RepID=UPI003555F41B